MNKGLKISLIVIGGIVGFVVIIMLLASIFGGMIVRSYVNNHGEDLLGRRVNVEHVGINLFTGHVAIRDLDIYEEDKTTSFAGFDTLDVSLRLLAFIDKELYVNHITLSGLDVKAIQNGTTFNFTSMLEHFKDNDTIEEEKDTTPSEWIVNLHQIRLRNGNVSYIDMDRDSRWGLQDVNLLIPDFIIGGKDRTKGGLSLQLADGGSLNADLNYDATSNDFTLKLVLDQFSLNQAQPYVIDFAHIDKIGGHLSVHADVIGNLDRVAEMVVKGNVQVDGFDVIDNHNASVASIDSVRVLLNQIDLGKNLFDIASVEIAGLRASYHTFADYNTLSALLKERKQAPADSSRTQDKDANVTQGKAASKPMQLKVGHFELRNSEVTYADHTLPKDFVFPVRQIRIVADDITTTGENNARISAQLPNGGHAMIKWEGNISEWKQHQHLMLRIKNLHLDEFNPYMLAYLGQPFTDGTFSFVSDNRINHSELRGKNQIDIFKATVDKRQKGIDAKMHLPLKAALYILKDKDDKILLDVPISGNIDKPEFNYMKLVWKTLGNLLVKVATSPVRALGNVFQSDKGGDAVMPIDGRTPDFSSEQFYKIDQLAEMAKQDESITLHFIQQMPVTADSMMVVVGERRNHILQMHLKQVGVADSQLKISQSRVEGLMSPQYVIKSEVAGLDDDMLLESAATDSSTVVSPSASSDKIR